MKKCVFLMGLSPRLRGLPPEAPLSTGWNPDYPHACGGTLLVFGGWLFPCRCQGNLHLGPPYSHTTPSPSASRMY